MGNAIDVSTAVVKRVFADSVGRVNSDRPAGPESPKAFNDLDRFIKAACGSDEGSLDPTKLVRLTANIFSEIGLNSTGGITNQARTDLSRGFELLYQAGVAFQEANPGSAKWGTSELEKHQRPQGGRNPEPGATQPGTIKSGVTSPAPGLSSAERLTRMVAEEGDLSPATKLAAAIQQKIFSLADRALENRRFDSSESEPGRLTATVEFALPTDVASQVKVLGDNQSGGGGRVANGKLSAALTRLSQAEAREKGYEEFVVGIKPNPEGGGYTAQVTLTWIPSADAVRALPT